MGRFTSGGGFVLGWAGAAAALSVLAPHRAQACSIAAPPRALVGYPADGALDVPTDVVPFYDLSRAGIGNLVGKSFRLESSAGDVVDVSTEVTHQWTFALTPDQELAPETTYTLSAIVPQDLPALTFTTGSGPVAEEPQPPLASLHHYQLEDGPRTSCSPHATGTCVAVASGLPVEAADIDEFGQVATVAYLYEASWFTNLSGIDQGTNFACVRLRSRAPNGTYSAPVDLCGKDGELVTLPSTEQLACTPAGVTTDVEPIDEPPDVEPPDAEPPDAEPPDAEPPVEETPDVEPPVDGTPEVRPANESQSCSYSARRMAATDATLSALCALLLLARRRRTPS